jgi:hypothetical protein
VAGFEELTFLKNTGEAVLTKFLSKFFLLGESSAGVQFCHPRVNVTLGDEGHYPSPRCLPKRQTPFHFSLVLCAPGLLPAGGAAVW